jgi:hypothetical protein
VTLPKFEVGDLADRKDRDLDPRPVSRVKGNYIWLQIGGISEHGPLHMSLYRRIPKARVEAVAARYAERDSLDHGAAL